VPNEGGAGRRYFRAYLRIAPLALALWRAAEAQAIARAELPRPLLDLGCGFAEFGSVFFEQPVEVGLDISRSDLRLARRRGVYRNLVQSDGGVLPFRDGTFPTVLSVSVLEHIDRVERVIPEVWRVLRPGGTFIFTTPEPEMGGLLFYQRLTSALRVGALGRAYGKAVDRFFHHVSVKTMDEWTSLLEATGFQVRAARRTIPPRLMAAFDLTLPGALPSQAGRILDRGRWVWRPPGVVALCDRLFGGLVEDDRDEGCNLFFVAGKPAG
jgi:SAM-dependent methyltransferase